MVNHTRSATRISWGRVRAKVTSPPARQGVLVWARHGSPAAWQVPAAWRVPDDPGREELCLDPPPGHEPVALSTQGLVTYLQGLFGPLFLGIVGIVALFFLFTREITRFVQFIVLAVLIAIVFYTPGIVQALATGITNALGVH